MRRLPSHIRIGLVRGDSGLGATTMPDAAEALGLKFIFGARLTRPGQAGCRHDDAGWQPTDIPGVEVQERALDRPGRRFIRRRTRVTERPQGGGKTLLEAPCYKFQTLVANLPPSVPAMAV